MDISQSVDKEDAAKLRFAASFPFSERKFRFLRNWACY